MKICLELSTDERIALRKFMAAFQIEDPASAVSNALRDWLIGMGYLEFLPELEEDSGVAGEA